MIVEYNHSENQYVVSNKDGIGICRNRCGICMKYPGDAIYTDIDSWHAKLNNFLNSMTYQVISLTLIILNSIMLGVMTFEFATENKNHRLLLDNIDTFFLVCFTIELGLHFLNIGLYAFLDDVLLFDAIIVALSWSCSALSVFRAFRILRVLRLVTHLRALRSIISTMVKVTSKLMAYITINILHHENAQRDIGRARAARCS